MVSVTLDNVCVKQQTNGDVRRPLLTFLDNENPGLFHIFKIILFPAWV